MGCVCARGCAAVRLGAAPPPPKATGSSPPAFPRLALPPSLSLCNPSSRRHVLPSRPFSLPPSLQICVPDWPFYNKHPVKWLDQIPPSKEATKAD